MFILHYKITNLFSVSFDYFKSKIRFSFRFLSFGILRKIVWIFRKVNNLHKSYFCGAML